MRAQAQGRRRARAAEAARKKRAARLIPRRVHGQRDTPRESTVFLSEFSGGNLLTSEFLGQANPPQLLPAWDRRAEYPGRARKGACHLSHDFQ